MNVLDITAIIILKSFSRIATNGRQIISEIIEHGKSNAISIKRSKNLIYGHRPNSLNDRNFHLQRQLVGCFSFRSLSEMKYPQRELCCAEPNLAF